MRIVSLLLVSASLYSMGVTASPVSSQALIKCAQIAQDEARLHCFDAVVSQLQSAPARPASAAQSAPVAQSSKSAPPPAPTPATKKQSQGNNNFGLEEKQRQQAADEISAMITKVDQGPRDKLIISLDNNMVWKQKDSAFISAKKGRKATVKAGALGAFYLKVEGSNRRIRVERLR